VRFRILRALGHIAAGHPEVNLNEEILQRAIERTIDAATELLLAHQLVRGAAEDPGRVTSGHSLIVMLLRDKERHAVERIFRLLGLRFRREDLRSIHRGLANANPKTRAGSRNCSKTCCIRRSGTQSSDWWTISGTISGWRAFDLISRASPLDTRRSWIYWPPDAARSSAPRRLSRPRTRLDDGRAGRATESPDADAFVARVREAAAALEVTS
jgi:hypothetical protein